MKKTILIIVLVLTAASLATATWSQCPPEKPPEEEGVMLLRSKAFPQHLRAAVVFDHFVHESIVRCRVCHHDFNNFDDRSKGKGSKCSTCHKAEGTEDLPVTLLDAMHGNCRGCHQRAFQREADYGPLMCAGCHCEEKAMGFGKKK